MCRWMYRWIFSTTLFMYRWIDEVACELQGHSKCLETTYPGYEGKRKLDGVLKPVPPVASHAGQACLLVYHVVC